MELLVLGLVMIFLVAAGVLGAVLLFVGLVACLGYSIGGPCGAVCGALVAMALLGGMGSGRK